MNQVIRRQLKQMEAAAARYRETAKDRREIKRRQKAEGSRVVDSPEQVRARVERLARSGALPAETLVPAIVPEEDLDSLVFLERIIGETNDLQGANFLSRGARAAGTIARISIQEGEGGFGTGFLVAPSLLLTNNHVLSSAEVAEVSQAEFNFEIGPDKQPGEVAVYRLDPRSLFLTDEHLDFSLVAVEPGDDGEPPAERFGWNELDYLQGKIVTGEAVNIAGHPLAEMKQISIRNNQLANQLDDFLHYVTDTEPGNSGSPVFNDQWEVVALHHSGVPRTDDDGNVLKKDGTVFDPDRDDPDEVDWVANEGARVSRLLHKIARLGESLGEPQQELLKTMGRKARPRPPEPPKRGERRPRRLDRGAT